MKSLPSTSKTKVTIGLLIGIGLLFLVSRFVNISTSIQVLQQHLATPRGIILALLSGMAFLLAFSIRGVRWKLFLHPVAGSKVSTFKAIQLFLVGIFLNFLLPIQGGELAKCLMLKRLAGISSGRSLLTVAMDRSLDLMPALFIITIVPFLGVHMDIKLWLVLGIVVGLLITLICFVGLAAWKRAAAVALLKKITTMLPKAIGDKIEGFATGFVDSLLISVSRPRIFLPAILLTCVALTLDGVFAMLAFWTAGYYIPLGTAIFGYTTYNMFTILPTPPGQVGSNEAVGLLVFAGLLHLPANNVLAMFVFSHPWAALIMSTTGIACLSSLGLKFHNIMKVQLGESDVERKEVLLSEEGKIPVQHSSTALLVSMKQISLKPSGRLITLALMPEAEGQKQLLLDLQTAIITGAAKGIGRGIAIEMAQEGANIVLADIDEEGMGETERMITAIGRTCLNVRTDVQDIEQGHRLVKATLQQFGKIDILVNNAGINTPGATQILEVSTDAYDRVLQTNLRGPFFLSQYVAQEMVERKTRGSVLFTSSTHVRVISMQPAYSASKGHRNEIERFQCQVRKSGNYPLLTLNAFNVSAPRDTGAVSRTLLQALVYVIPSFRPGSLRCARGCNSSGGQCPSSCTPWWSLL